MQDDLRQRLGQGNCTSSADSGIPSARMAKYMRLWQRYTAQSQDDSQPSDDTSDLNRPGRSMAESHATLPPESVSGTARSRPATAPIPQRSLNSEVSQLCSPYRSHLPPRRHSAARSTSMRHLRSAAWPPKPCCAPRVAARSKVCGSSAHEMDSATAAEPCLYSTQASSPSQLTTVQRRSSSDCWQRVKPAAAQNAGKRFAASASTRSAADTVANENKGEAAFSALSKENSQASLSTARATSEAANQVRTASRARPASDWANGRVPRYAQPTASSRHLLACTRRADSVATNTMSPALQAHTFSQRSFGAALGAHVAKRSECLVSAEMAGQRCSNGLGGLPAIKEGDGREQVGPVDSIKAVWG